MKDVISFIQKPVISESVSTAMFEKYIEIGHKNA